MIEIRVFLGNTLQRTVDLVPMCPLVVGRSIQSDVHLVDLYASREHARIELTANGLTLLDLGSAAGTRLNGEALSADAPTRAPLPCTLEIGRHRLEIGWPDETGASSIWSDYAQGELLGEGSSGQVFAATRRADDLPVAVKELAIFDPRMLERFRCEARLCQQLRHPNLVQIYEVREEDDGLYQVLELIEGGYDLKDHQRSQGALPIAEVLEIAEAVAQGLNAIHEAGVVHRDIKPANIMRAPDGCWKITDFGLARALEAGDTLTKPNASMGTLSYMAPEQVIDAKTAGPRSDLYSLGATLYQALTGQLPFPQTRLEDLLDALDQGMAPDVDELRTDCPPALARLIHRLLARDPDERYADAKRFLARLAKVRESLA